MNTPNAQTPLPGSYRKAVPDARLLSSSDPNEKITVSVYARRNPGPPAVLQAARDKLAMELPKNRRYLNMDEFDKLYGADPADLEKIKNWAKAHKLEVLSESVSKRQVKIQGKISDVSEAFGVSFHEYEHPSLGRFRGRTGNIYVADDLYKVIDGVFGLDTRPIGRPRLRRSFRTKLPLKAFKATGGKGALDLKNQWPGTFFPTEVASLYNYPANSDGTGQNIALFAFNGPPGPDQHGGYNLAALKEYYQTVLGQSVPVIQDVVIQGKGNNPGPDSPATEAKGDSTGEVMLDMCIAGAVAPGAKIFMYFTEFNSKGWVDAIHDAVAGKNNISVISISYGNPEQDPQSLWTQMGVKLVDQAFEAAAARGITICCSSGDDGSSDEGTGKAEVDFPASSPNVLAVGGTKLVATAGPKPKISSEIVWNEIRQQMGASGGGVSVVFSKPAYQDGVQIPVSVNPPHQIGRGMPDVSAVGDPESGVVVMHVDGKSLDPVGGTSASAPLWGALVARLNQAMKTRCGFLNEVLYNRFASGVLRDITKGNNGAYPAGKGWDACTGLGSPDGQKLLKALSGPATKSVPKKKKTR
jgi:kumamolisin